MLMLSMQLLINLLDRGGKLGPHFNAQFLSIMNENRSSQLKDLTLLAITNISWYIWFCMNNMWFDNIHSNMTIMLNKMKNNVFLSTNLPKGHVHSCIQKFKIITFFMLLVMLQVPLKLLKLIGFILLSMSLNVTLILYLEVPMASSLVRIFIEMPQAHLRNFFVNDIVVVNCHYAKLMTEFYLLSLIISNDGLTFSQNVTLWLFIKFFLIQKLSFGAPNQMVKLP